MQALEYIPVVEDRAGVELVEDLAEYEGVEQDAARVEGEEEGARGGAGGGSVVINRATTPAPRFFRPLFRSS